MIKASSTDQRGFPYIQSFCNHIFFFLKNLKKIGTKSFSLRLETLTEIDLIEFIMIICKSKINMGLNEKLNFRYRFLSRICVHTKNHNLNTIKTIILTPVVYVY